MTLSNINSFDVISLILVCISIFVAVYFNSRKIRRENKIMLNEKLEKKADIKYVDDKFIEIEKDIIEVKTAIHHLGKGNDKQHKELSDEIKEVGEGVEWIKGYLKAKQEDKK